MQTEWTVEDVACFLEASRPKFGDKCDLYKRLVLENDIDGEVLVEMSDQHLQSLGIASFGHRHLILKRVQGLLAEGGLQLETLRHSTSDSRFRSSSHVAGHPQRFGGAGPHRNSGIQTTEDLLRQSLNASSKPAHPRLHLPTPKINESEIKIGRRIGSGSVGYVYECQYEQHAVAVKRHKSENVTMDQKALTDFEIEVGKMAALNHPCIVRCYGMLEPTPGIVMELVKGGPLFQILHGQRGETYEQYSLRLPWHKRMRYLLDAMYGLRAVHNASLIHGDFKTLNLLVEGEKRVKSAAHICVCMHVCVCVCVCVCVFVCVCVCTYM